MKALILATTAVVLAAQFSPVAAADEARKPTAQQEKMKTCNRDAREQKLKGDERKAFMKSCLSNKPNAAAPAASAPASKKK